MLLPLFLWPGSCKHLVDPLNLDLLTVCCMQDAVHVSRFQKAECAVQATAVDEKGQGNRAFAAKDFLQAIVHFSTCIALDPE